MDKKTEDKNLGGRPRFKINYKQLQTMCEIMATGEECAAVLGCDYDTLNKNLIRDYEEERESNKKLPEIEGGRGFTEFYKKHSATGKASLRRAQMQTAIEGKNPTMQIWLGKQHLQQKDNTFGDSDGSGYAIIVQKLVTETPEGKETKQGGS